MNENDFSYDGISEKTKEDDTYEHLEEEEKIASHFIEIVPGEKDGSEWLVLGGIYILHKKEKTTNQIFWECSGRRRFNCRFKCATFRGKDRLELAFMYKLETHDCGQSKTGPIIHKFKNSLKDGMKSDYKAKFSKVFEKERNDLIKAFRDKPDLLERINYELKDKRSYRLLAERAKNKCFPKIPKSHEEIDLSSMKLEQFLLWRTSHPDKDVKNKDIFLLGTAVTAEAWAMAEFKSGDGTFKITPRLFHQVKLCNFLL